MKHEMNLQRKYFDYIKDGTKRVVFDLGPHEYARVRDEGGGKIFNFETPKVAFEMEPPEWVKKSFF